MFRDLILTVIVGLVVALAAYVFLLTLEDKLRRLKQHRPLMVWVIGIGLLVVGCLAILVVYSHDVIQLPFANITIRISWPKFLRPGVSGAGLQTSLFGALICCVVMFVLSMSGRMPRRVYRESVAAAVALLLYKASIISQTDAFTDAVTERTVGLVITSVIVFAVIMLAISERFHLWGVRRLDGSFRRVMANCLAVSALAMALMI